MRCFPKASGIVVSQKFPGTIHPLKLPQAQRLWRAAEGKRRFVQVALWEVSG
jgi:hypothetical protein